jgi:hypothetical protein
MGKLMDEIDRNNCSFVCSEKKDVSVHSTGQGETVLVAFGK